MFKQIKEFFTGKPAEVVAEVPYKVDAPAPVLEAPAPTLPAMEPATAGFNYKDVKPRAVVVEPVSKPKKAPAAKKAPAVKKPRAPKQPKVS